MSDRIAVMCGGTIVKILERNEATQQKVLALALGHQETGDANGNGQAVSKQENLTFPLRVNADKNG